MRNATAVVAYLRPAAVATGKFLWNLPRNILIHASIRMLSFV